MGIPAAVIQQNAEAEAKFKELEDAQNAESSPSKAPVEEVAEEKETEEVENAESSLVEQIEALNADLKKRENDRSAYEGRYMKEREELQAKLDEQAREAETLKQALADAKKAEASQSVQLRVEDVYDEETRDEVGDDVLQAILNATAKSGGKIEQVLQAKVDELKAEIARSESYTNQTAVNVYRDSVLRGLNIKEQHLATVNDSDEFNTWLDIQDPFSGKTRGDMLQDAIDGHDINRTVFIYKGFLDTLGGGSKVPQAPASKKAVMPSESGVVTSSSVLTKPDGSSRTYNEIAQAYSKGQISNAEANKMMKALDAEMAKQV